MASCEDQRNMLSWRTSEKCEFQFSWQAVVIVEFFFEKPSWNVYVGMTI